MNKNIKNLSKEKYSSSIIKGNTNNANLNLVDYNKFLKGILSLKPSENFGKEDYIKKIFDEYKDNNDLIDMRIFNEKIF